MDDEYEGHRQNVEEKKHFVRENEDGSQNNFAFVPVLVVISYEAMPFFIDWKLLPLCILSEHP